MMISHSSSPAALFHSVTRHVDLLLQMTRRDALGRYKMSYLGALWAILVPLAMLLVYTFVFGVVFGARWPALSTNGDTSEFALVLFAGLIVFNFFAECVTRAPTLVIGNPSYVNKVVFPLEILPLVTLLSALFHLLVSVGLLLLAQALIVGRLPGHALLLPLVLLPISMLVLGFMWVLASLGVYVRDVGQLVSVVITPLMFMSPIFFPTEAVPEAYRWLMHLNPLTTAVNFVRDILVFDRMPSLLLWLIYSSFCGVMMIAGFGWFQHTRRGFADVL